MRYNFCNLILLGKKNVVKGKFNDNSIYIELKSRFKREIIGEEQVISLHTCSTFFTESRSEEEFSSTF